MSNMSTSVCETGAMPALPGDHNAEYRTARREATDAVMKLLRSVREDQLRYAQPQPHACERCDTEFDRCTELIALHGRGCCGACYFVDTHGALQSSVGPDFRHIAALHDVARYAREALGALDRAHDAPANGRYWWEEDR